MAHPRASQRTRKPTHKASWRFPDNQIPSFGLATDESQTQLHETQQTQLLTPHTGHKRKASQPQPQPQPQGRRRRASSPLTIESGGEEGPGPDEEEPVDEDEVEEEEDEEEEEEETVVISQFAYTSVWTARFEGKKHDTFVKRNNNVTYSIIWHLIDQFLQKEYPQLKRRRFTATAWYPGLTKTSWIVSDCTCFSEVDDLVLEAFEKLFKPQRRTGIHIDVFLTLEKVEEPAAATPAVPSTAPPSTQPRRTPTAQMLAANADARDALGEHGNLSADLKVKWLCGQRDCRNFRTGDEGGYCYWRKSDVAYNHYPISQACFKQWAADIKDDLATVARPSEDAWHLLLQAKIAEANKSYKRRVWRRWWYASDELLDWVSAARSSTTVSPFCSSPSQYVTHRATKFSADRDFTGRSRRRLLRVASQ